MLQRLGGSPAVESLKQVQQQVQAAETALAQQHAREALESASAASGTLTQIQPLLQRLHAVDQQLTATEQVIGSLSGKLAASVRDLLTQGRSQLTKASHHVGSEVGENTLKEAEWLAGHAFKLGPDFERTRQELAGRINVLQATIPEMQQRLMKGREEFDIVDEFAPSSWSDIRGNGSEATAAVGQLEQLLQEAETELQTAEPDWAKALDLTDTAAARLQYSRDLLTAITNRLSDLEAAQKKGANEIETARRDVQIGWGYIRNNDADVGKEPEQALQEADKLLQTIDQHVATGKPDWLQVLAQVTQVRQFADTALAGARSEVEQMNARREHVKVLAQAAEAELGKLVNFARVHPLEVNAEQRQRIDQLAQMQQQAQQAVAQAEQTEEHHRITALDAAQKGYKALVDAAHPLYADIYERFQRLDTLRTEANTMSQTARQSLDNAGSWYQSYNYVMANNANGRALLEQGQRMWQAFNPQASEQELQRSIEANKEANRLAHEAANQIQQAAQLYQQTASHQGRRRDTDFGDLLTGMMLGQALGGNRRDGWGSGFGGGWGGNSHSWNDDRGSSGGSIFGGGGSSGGDWGGGGSIFGGGGGSGGDWGGGDSGGGSSEGGW